MNVNGHGQVMEPYMSSLSSATTMPISSGRNLPDSSDQDIQRQLEEFNRSVTIIFWYKANMEPIRLQQSIRAFPYFQLSRLGSLTNELGLSSSSYLDTYIPQSGKWEQHTISTVRLVETQQRLLYRIRKNLLEGLNEAECMGLDEEVDMQVKPLHRPSTASSSSGLDGALKRSRDDTSPPKPSSLKRPAMETTTPPIPRSIPNNTLNNTRTNTLSLTHNNNNNNNSIPNIPNNTSNSTSNNNNIPSSGLSNNSSRAPATIQSTYPPTLSPGLHIPAPQSFYNGTSPSTTPLPQYLTNPPTSAPPIPYHPHPPLKRWPNDYTVSELSAGFLAMDALIAQSPSGSSMTQRTAFERVFGSRYVKSTVCRHRAVWRKAHPNLREQFEAMGSDERACWGEFVRRVEGRPPGKMGQASTVDMQQTVMMYHPAPTSTGGNMMGDSMSRQALANEDEDGVEEPVMDSLQNPQGPSSGNVTMQSSMNVYDPALNQLSGTART
ncbi:hypothetical protein BDQ17DRAFT_1412499 [Cyathus striatus]|nr:hypothetical protein BDQ17DRAFT_1412499 [Cyathus striatus]